jgi:hypothetical protein
MAQGDQAMEATNGAFVGYDAKVRNSCLISSGLLLRWNIFTGFILRVGHTSFCVLLLICSSRDWYQGFAPSISPLLEEMRSLKPRKETQSRRQRILARRLEEAYGATRGYLL